MHHKGNAWESQNEDRKFHNPGGKTEYAACISIGHDSHHSELRVGILPEKNLYDVASPLPETDRYQKLILCTYGLIELQYIAIAKRYKGVWVYEKSGSGTLLSQGIGSLSLPGDFGNRDDTNTASRSKTRNLEAETPGPIMSIWTWRCGRRASNSLNASNISSSFSGPSKACDQSVTLKEQALCPLPNSLPSDYCLKWKVENVKYRE